MGITLTLFACGGGDEAPPDAGSADAGEVDSGEGPADSGAVEVDAGPPHDCGDCGEATACAEPFCDETTGQCNPGYLTRALDDDVPGDCTTLTCTGSAAEPLRVPDDTDTSSVTADVCGQPICTDGVPGVAPASAGTECDGQPGYCDGLGATADSCKRCVDTEPDPYTADVGCTRERSFCFVDESLSRGGCFSANRWDEGWGGATIGTDGLTVVNLGARTHARSTITVSSGAYYWEIRVVMGEEMVNDGGVGILDPTMSLADDWIGAGSSGFSFGYGNGNPRYYTGWRTVDFPSGTPPAACFVDAGRVFMFALDVDSGRLWVGAEGVWFNGGDPEQDLRPAATGIPPRVTAGVTLYEQRSAAFEANFMGPFQFPVPAGFRPGLF